MNAPISSPHHALAEALRLRVEVIKDTTARDQDPAAHLKRLQQASEEIIARQQRLPAPVDAQLAHYLQRCSYDKAFAWLEENTQG